MMKKCKLMPKFLMLLMIGIIIIGLFSISRYSYYVSLSCEKLEISKISGKIYINGNSGWIDFKNDGNCTGEGTYSEPYVIEDLVIEGVGSGSYIIIENSDVYFKIENCTISGASVSGIRLSNVTNSLLNNNTLNNNDNGITLIGSNYNTISGNIIINNDDQGIYVYGS
ncbi:MAG: NosD domain-containing protein, partial [Promethearchaeota archaeon]